MQMSKNLTNSWDFKVEKNGITNFYCTFCSIVLVVTIHGEITVLLSCSLVSFCITSNCTG